MSNQSEPIKLAKDKNGDFTSSQLNFIQINNKD